MNTKTLEEVGQIETMSKKPAARRSFSFRYRMSLQESLLFVLVIGLALGMLFPFYWMVNISLQTREEIITLPLKWLPFSFVWENYPRAWTIGKMGLYTQNSITVALAHVLLQVFTCTLAAYAFARLHFPGKNPLFILLLATNMIPWPVTIIPSFILIKSIPLVGGNDILGAGGIGLLNTLWSIILPGAVNVIGIFFLRQFLLNLPTELEDAARVDGCNEFGVLWYIIVPICVPGMATFALLSFETSWNSFIWPLIMLSRQAVFTLPVGLRAFYDAGAAGDNFIDYGPLMAASVLFILPVLLIFLAAQRVFVQGITLSGIKG